MAGLASAPPHEKIAGYFAVSVDIQRRIGTFVLISSLVEQTLEHLAWTLRPEIPTDKPVWTDRYQTSDLIKETLKLSEDIKPDSLRGIAQKGLSACDNMLTVRHTVIHGRLAGGVSGLGPSLARNKSTLGEIRKRQQSTVALKADSLDAAGHVMERVFMILSAVGIALAGPSPEAGAFVLSKLDDVDEICSKAQLMRDDAMRTV